MVLFFSSGIDLFIFLPINPAIYRISNTPNILCPRCKEQDEYHSSVYLFIARFPKLLQTNLNYINLVSKPSQWKFHLNRMMASILRFYWHLSYCRRKAFNEAYDKINKFSNFKYNLLSRFNKFQDTATELGLKDTFLRTWDSLINYDQSLNIQFN